MQDRNKKVVRISDEGIIFINFLLADYTMLVNLIASKNCILWFDSDEAFNALKEQIEPFIEDRCNIELAVYIRHFITEQYTQQVFINSIYCYD